MATARLISWKKNLLIALLLMPGMLIPVFAQEEDSFDDDVLLWEAAGITVTGTPETTQFMDVVEKAELEKFSAPDLTALLQDVLNLGATRYGAYGNDSGINLRGFDARRVAILVDGIPANSSQEGKFDINQIDPSTVERIEVIYGGSDSKYNVSGALGGVINIITIKPQNTGFRFGGSVSNTSAIPGSYYNSFGQAMNPHWEDLVDSQNVSANASYGWDRTSLTGSFFFNSAQNHFLYRDDLNIVRRKESNEVLDFGTRLSFIRDIAEAARLILSGDVYFGDKNIPISGYSRLSAKQQDLSHSENVLFEMPRAFHDALGMEASLSHKGYNRFYEPLGGGYSQHNENLVSAINRWNWYPFDVLTLRAGWDFRFSYLDSTDMGEQYRNDGGIYLTAEYRPLDSLLIIPSIKGVFSGPNAEMPAVPVPKLGFLWTPTDYISVKNNYFRSFKHPDFQDLYWAGSGNPDLKPEDGWGADIGLDYRFWDIVSVGSAFFVQWTQDSIHWFSSGSGWRPENVGEAIYFGLENKATVSIPLGAFVIPKIELSLSYQFLLSYLLSYGYTFDTEMRIPYMPMHSVGFTVEVPWKLGDKNLPGAFIVSGQFQSLRYADTANLKELDPYFVMNIDMNQRINDYFTAFLGVRNVLNTSFESFTNYPMPGITIITGVRVHVGQ